MLGNSAAGLGSRRLKVEVRKGCGGRGKPFRKDGKAVILPARGIPSVDTSFDYKTRPPCAGTEIKT